MIGASEEGIHEINPCSFVRSKPNGQDVEIQRGYPVSEEKVEIMKCLFRYSLRCFVTHGHRP